MPQAQALTIFDIRFVGYCKLYSLKQKSNFIIFLKITIYAMQNIIVH